MSHLRGEDEPGGADEIAATRDALRTHEVTDVRSDRGVVGVEPPAEAADESE